MVLTRSLCEGPTHKPLLRLTMGGALDHAVAHFPDREAFVYPFENTSLTYRQLHTKVCQVAAALVSRGLKAGDGVALWTDVHCMELEVFSHAVTYSGLILVGVFLMDIEDILSKITCKAIIFPNFTWEFTNRESRLGRLLGTTSDPVTHHEKNTDSIASIAILPSKTSENSEILSFKTLMEEGRGLQAENHLLNVKETIKGDDVAVIMLTSGTTGRPKGVTSTHSSMVNNGYFIGDRLDYISKEHRICSLMQRYDDIGLVEAMCAFMHGATIVNPERNYDVEDITRVMQVIQDQRCTGVHGFPSHFVNIISEPSFTTYNFETVHTGFTCAAPMFSKKMLEILDKFTPDLVPGFGTTETKRNIQGFVTDSRIKRAETIGYPMPHTKVKIIDEESNIVPIGGSGELCLHSYSTMVKYWNQPEKTSEAIDEDGWYHTGDLASMDPDGYVRMVGRIKDQICTVNTDKVYAAEVEDILMKHPLIEDVAVVGVVDPGGRGEEICAMVKIKQNLSLTAKEIYEFLTENDWENFQTPRHILFTETFPLNKRGKKVKADIRKEAARRLGRLTLEESFQ